MSLRCVTYTDAAIEAVELNRAELLWIHSVQAQTFQKEISYLFERSLQSGEASLH